MEKYKEKLVVLGIIVIIPTLILLFYRKGVVRTIKKDKDSSLPKIEIESATVDSINKYIKKLYSEYTSDGKSKMTYTYQTYGNIVSVLIDIKEYDKKEKNYVQKYLSYNIDKEAASGISDEDFASILGYDILDIAKKVEEKLKYYYEDEINKGYVDNKCDFECYLKTYRKVDYAYYMVVLTLKNNKPIVYLNLFNNGATKDYEYFSKLKDNPYKIVLE